MGRQKLVKGKPKKGEARTEYGEQKVNVNLSLTPLVRDNLDIAATALGISRSELFERLGRKGEAWLVEQGRESRMGATPEEQIALNQPAMEWAAKRIEEMKR